ncbi:hypothetical protein RUND412_008467 [Rhizina undulata]
MFGTLADHFSRPAAVGVPSSLPTVSISTFQRPIQFAGKTIISIPFPSVVVDNYVFLFSLLPIAALVTFFLLASWVVVHHYRARNNTPLRHVPGPWLASCSILYRFYYAVLKGNWHKDLTDLHRKYGDVVRIAPNEVSIWNPEIVSEIYAHGDRGYPKCEMYDIALPNGFFNLAVERDIARHASGRRAIANDYTMMSTLQNEKYFDNVIQEFITAIDKNFASVGKVCDFTIWSEYFTYDMITDLVFGESFGFCRMAKDVGGGLRDLRQMLNLSPLLSYMPWIWGLTKNKQVKKAGQSHYSTSTRRKINKRLEDGNPSGRRDLLQGLLEAKYKEDGHKLPLGEITNHAYIFILAAPDTASVALRSIVMNLVRNPHYYERLMSELKAARLSAVPTWRELQAVPFLSAIVKESLRLHPPAGFTLPRAVPEGGRTICGYYIPEGTTVGMSAWCVHANKDFWGQNIDEFKPERWLDEKSAQMLERYGLTFGQGARGCLGKHIALLQLVKVTAQLVLNFDFGIVDEKKVKDVFLLLVVIDNLKVWFKRRPGGPLDRDDAAVETEAKSAKA